VRWVFVLSFVGASSAALAQPNAPDTTATGSVGPPISPPVGEAPLAPIGPPPPPKWAAPPELLAPREPLPESEPVPPLELPPVTNAPAPNAAAPSTPAPSTSVPVVPIGPPVAPPPPVATAPPSTASRTPVPVRLGDGTVFNIRADRGGKTAEERARLASRALLLAVDDPRASEVKVVRQGDVAVVYAGPVPLIQLAQEDADAAGDSSLDVHAGAAASAIRQALDSERQRSRVAKNVFSVSLAVFFALIAFYLMRKVGEIAERVKEWLNENGDRALAIRVQHVEIVRPATLRNSAVVGLEIAKWLGQFGIFYAWLVIVLSLFEATRGYTERLTGLVVTPLSDLMGRLARSLPLLVVAMMAALAVFVLVRFVGLFFASVARRETTLAWLPPDLAAPTSVLLRFSIVVAALIFAAPVVTGDSEGVFARAGMVILAAIGISSAPLLASGLVGSVVLFGRRLRVGEHAEVGGSLGRIAAINLLELRLLLPDMTELRIPHLLLLGRPLRGLGVAPRISIDVAVSSGVNPTTVRGIFDEAGSRVGRDVRAEVVMADADGVIYRVTATCDSLEHRSALWTALLEALSAAGVPLGRDRGTTRPA
jgi:small-conductance mechanosensitive channel